MNRFSLLIKPFVIYLSVLLFNTSCLNAREREIYIINYAWHTGIVIPVDSFSISQVSGLKNFSGYRFADIGWGDEDFYQNEDFDLFLAAKALLLPTPSALRIEGYNIDIKKAARYFDKCVMIRMNDSAYFRLLDFISASFRTAEERNNQILSVRDNGRIAYYKARGCYYLYNTCNTWIGKALGEAGYRIDYRGVVTVDDIFREVKDISIKLK